MVRISVASMIAGLVAGIAIAQPYPPQGRAFGPPPGPGWSHEGFWRGAPDSPRERIQFLQDRIDRAVSNRLITPDQARHASVELDRTRGRMRQMHYQDGGPLTGQDRALIERGLNDVSRQLTYWTHRDTW